MITIALLSCVKKVATMGSEKKVMMVMKAMKVKEKTMKAMKAWKEKKDKVLRGQRPAGITFLDNIFERRRGILIFGNYVDRNVFG